MLASGGANIYTGSSAPTLSVLPEIFDGYYQWYDNVPDVSMVAVNIEGVYSTLPIQTPVPPLSTIAYTNNQAIVSWPFASTGWMLQTNSNASAANWVNYTCPVVNNTPTNSPPKGNLFFRLTHPRIARW